MKWLLFYPNLQFSDKRFGSIVVIYCFFCLHLSTAVSVDVFADRSVLQIADLFQKRFETIFGFVEIVEFFLEFEIIF